MRRLFLTVLFLLTLLSISNRSGAQTLINYWNFNNFSATDTFPNIPVFKASYSLIDTNKAVLTYIPQSGASLKSEDSAWVDFGAGTTVGAYLGAPAGNYLRIRNPTDNMEMRFYTPTTNFKNISFTYALETSSLTSGDSIETFDYSVDSGVTWNTSALTVNGANVDTVFVAQTLYNSNFALVTIGFGSDTNVNNNPKLVFRIKFKRANTSTSGNNRFDNVAVIGSYLASSITVVTPPVGDTLYGGQQQAISYTTTGVVTPTRTIYFSTDSGATWKQILSTTQTTYTWTVPNANSNNCFIEIVDSNGITGKSGRFSMRPPAIILLQPTAGGTLIAGNSQLISYETFGGISNFRAIDYSTDSGKTWAEIAITTLDTFTWVVPNDTSSNCFVEIIDAKGTIGKSGKFVILFTKPLPPPPPPPPAWLIHYWNFSTYNAPLGDTIPNVPRLKAFYSAIDTNKAIVLDSLIPGTSKFYVSFVDNTPGDTCNALLGDQTTNALRVRNPSDSMQLLIFMPSTGYKNLSLNFGLESSSTGSGQSIEYYAYSVDGGSSWRTSGLTVNGTAVDTLNLLTYKANGAAIYEKGGPPGTGYGLMSIGINDTAANNNPNLVFRVQFKAQNTGTSGNNRFEHIALEGTSLATPPPPPPPPVPDSIVVTAPVRGDSLLSGTQQTISYTVTASTSYTRSIQYSTNGGSTWLNIDTAITALSYTWTVPPTPSTNAIVRVKDSTGVIGMSSPFVILVPGTVDSIWLSPSPIIAGATENIMWKATGYLGNSFTVNVFYDGVTPNLLTSGSTEASGSYVWTVPNAEVTGVFVQVVFASGSSENSAPFDIVAPASVFGGSNAVTNVELWPNPFQTQTTIQYQLNSSENVTLSIHDLLGREIESIQEGTESAGEHEIVFDGTHQPAGAYIYELTVGDTHYRGQLVIVR